MGLKDHQAPILCHRSATHQLRLPRDASSLALSTSSDGAPTALLGSLCIQGSLPWAGLRPSAEPSRSQGGVRAEESLPEEEQWEQFG